MIWKILTVILAVSVAVLIAVLVKIRAQLRDINEQLDFLCEKDTNMLLLTDTNMADIGRLKERINRFLEQWHRQRREPRNARPARRFCAPAGRHRGQLRGGDDRRALPQ